ncbi:MAG: hypothetical protein EPO06_04995 [Burkholderiaceae bacterium]|nr:MAG: hypothetical protein EPO06_04995 [Burkholderiaceae bacterium]
MFVNAEKMPFNSRIYLLRCQGGVVVTRIPIAFVFFALFTILAQAEDKQPTVQDIPILMTYSCAVGAVEAAYALARDKLSGNPDKDAFLIANVSKQRCVTPGYVAALFPNASRQRAKDQADEVGMLAEMKYLSYVSDIITARAGAQREPRK